MLRKLKFYWRDLTRGQPGRRFQERYARHQLSRQGQGWHRRFARMAFGLIVVAVGVVFMFIPGPGIPFFVFGVSILAADSEYLSRFADWTEIKIRALLRQVHRRWQQASLPTRSSIVALGILGTVAAAYVVYRMIKLG